MSTDPDDSGHFSPTALADATVCPLRTALLTSRAPHAPRSREPRRTPPAARYGLVAHRVLELIAPRLLEDDWELHFEELWERSLSEQATLARDAGDDERYGRLREWSRRDLTRLRLRKRLAQLGEELRAMQPDLIETEVWLETSHPPIRGRADLIVRSTDGSYWLVDLKTGPVPTDEVPTYHRTQLHTYGFLLAERGAFPDRLSILSLPSGIVEVTADPDAVSSDVQEAHRRAAHAAARPSEVMATPGPAACRSCTVLSRCPVAPRESESWPERPIFVWGRVTDVSGPPQRLRVEIAVTASNLSLETIVLHDIETATQPDAASIQLNDHVVAVDVEQVAVGPNHLLVGPWSRFQQMEQST